MTSNILTGCGNQKFNFPYDSRYDVTSYQVIQKENKSRADTFAADLCIATTDLMDDDAVDMSEAYAAALFDLDNSQMLYSKNAHERMYPASLTKVMTAIVALKYGSMDQVLTAGQCINLSESGAQLAKVAVGDTMTLSQALHILLVYSANDVAMMIAEGVGGTVERFMEMMNEEAAALGATNTHFVNPHGLSDVDHYTTIYDLYLMFNEAIKADTFKEIIHMSSYSTVYYDKDGNEKEFSRTTTNRYLTGDFEAPDKVTVIGGKTGTTNAAGHCLILLAKDTGGASYVSVILRSSSKDILYSEMTDLLNEIGK